LADAWDISAWRYASIEFIGFPNRLVDRLKVALNLIKFKRVLDNFGYLAITPVEVESSAVHIGSIDHVAPEDGIPDVPVCILLEILVNIEFWSQWSWLALKLVEVLLID